MKDEISKGLAQWPPTIKIDYEELIERWRNLSREEKLEAVCNYIKSVYGKTLDRMALGARMEADGFAALVETLDILSDNETMDAIREAEAEDEIALGGKMRAARESDSLKLSSGFFPASRCVCLSARGCGLRPSRGSAAIPYDGQDS